METNTSYRKSYYFQNLYHQMKKDLHYTDKQMYKHFPWFNKLITDEIIQNFEVLNKILLNKVAKGIK